MLTGREFFGGLAKSRNEQERWSALKLFTTQNKCRLDWFPGVINSDDIEDGWQAAYTVYLLSGTPQNVEQWEKLQHRLCSHFKAAVSEAVKFRLLSVANGNEILRSMAARINTNGADLARLWCGRLLRFVRKDGKRKLAKALRAVWNGQAGEGNRTQPRFLMEKNKAYLQRASVACISIR